MKSILKQIGKSLLLVPALLLSFSAVAPTVGAVAADCPTDATGEQLNISTGANCAKGNNVSDNLFGSGGVFQTVTNILLFLIGAISVIMLIIGGIRYVISGGDQNQVTGAKNTILYAIVGIIVAFLAFAAVSFVTNQLSQNA